MEGSDASCDNIVMPPKPSLLSIQGHEYTPYELADGFYKHVNLFTNNKKLTLEKQRGDKLIQQYKNPKFKAEKIWTLGLETVLRIEQDLERLCCDSTEQKFVRFTDMIKAVYNLMDSRGGMRLEMFQVELMRGFFLGIAANQFGSDLFKYKHRLLDYLGLATPEISSFNPMCPSKITSELIDDIFNEYGKNYTLALAPRQCGKTEIMTILLAAMISFLDIEIVVQAQHKVMCESIYARVARVIHEIQYSPWYPEENRIKTIHGTTETREFIYDENYKGVTKVHFLSSSPNVCIFLFYLLFSRWFFLSLSNRSSA